MLRTRTNQGRTLAFSLSFLSTELSSIGSVSDSRPDSVSDPSLDWMIRKRINVTFLLFFFFFFFIQFGDFLILLFHLFLFFREGFRCLTFGANLFHGSRLFFLLEATRSRLLGLLFSFGAAFFLILKDDGKYKYLRLWTCSPIVTMRLNSTVVYQFARLNWIF